MPCDALSSVAPGHHPCFVSNFFRLRMLWRYNSFVSCWPNAPSHIILSYYMHISHISISKSINAKSLICYHASRPFTSFTHPHQHMGGVLAAVVLGGYPGQLQAAASQLLASQCLRWALSQGGSWGAARRGWTRPVAAWWRGSVSVALAGKKCGARHWCSYGSIMVKHG